MERQLVVLLLLGAVLSGAMYKRLTLGTECDDETQERSPSWDWPCPLLGGPGPAIRPAQSNLYLQYGRGVQHHPSNHHQREDWIRSDRFRWTNHYHTWFWYLCCPDLDHRHLLRRRYHHSHCYPSGGSRQADL